MAKELYEKIVAQIKNRPLLAILFGLRSAFLVGAAIFGLAYIAYREHSQISNQVTSDFSVLAQEQEELLAHLSSLVPSLLNPNITVQINEELTETRNLAEEVLAALSRFRAPTRAISNARAEYRDALENLIGVAHRIEREGTDGMALSLHNSLQSAENEGGNFLGAIEDFQGGAWPQVIGAFF